MRPKKLLLVVLGGVVAVLAILTVVLKLMFPPERLKALVLAELEQHIDRQIAVGDVGFSVISRLGIDVADLSVGERPEFGASAHFVDLDRFILHVKLWPLLDRQLIVDELTLEHPRISIRINKEGVANYADLMKPDTAAVQPAAPEQAAPPFSIQASSIRIEDGVIHYKDDRTGTQLDIEGVNYTTALSVDTETRIAAAGRLTLGNIRIQRPEGPLGGIGAQLDHNVTIDPRAHAIAVDALDLTLQQMGVSLKGRITDYDADTARVDLTVASSDVTLEKLLASVPPDMAADMSGVKGAGRIGIEGSVRGPVADGLLPDIAATLTLRDGRLETPDLPVPVTAITGDIAVHNATARIQKLAARAGASDLSLAGTVSNLYGGGPGARPHAHLTLTSDFLNLDEISPPVENPAQATPYKPLPDLVVTGEGTGKKVRVSGIDFTDARLTLTMQDQIVHLSDITAGVYGGRITGSIVQDLRDVKHPKVGLDTRIEQVDVVQVLAPFLPVKDLLSGRITTSFSANTPLDSVGNPVINVLSALGSLSIDGGRVANWEPLRKLSAFLKVPDVETVDFRSLAGAFQIDNGRLHTRGLQLAGGPTEWMAVGSAGLDGSLDYQMRVMFSPDLTARVGSGLAGHALSLFKDDKGRAGVTFRVGGTLKDPKFSWDTGAFKQQVTTKLTQEAQKLFMDQQQKLLGKTPIATTDVDTLTKQAETVVKTAVDSLKSDAKAKAKDALRNLFKRE